MEQSSVSVRDDGRTGQALLSQSSEPKPGRQSGAGLHSLTRQCVEWRGLPDRSLDCAEGIARYRTARTVSLGLLPVAVAAWRW